MVVGLQPVQGGPCLKTAVIGSSMSATDLKMDGWMDNSYNNNQKKKNVPLLHMNKKMVF